MDHSRINTAETLQLRCLPGVEGMTAAGHTISRHQKVIISPVQSKMQSGAASTGHGPTEDSHRRICTSSH